MTETPKMAKELTPQQRQITIEAIKRGNPPPTFDPPDPTAPKMARDMSVGQRQEFLRAHARKYR